MKKKLNKKVLPKHFPAYFYFFPDQLPAALFLCSVQASLLKKSSAQASAPASSFAVSPSSPAACESSLAVLESYPEAPVSSASVPPV